MKFTQEAIVDLIINGPRTLKRNSDEFDELLESYMETFTSNMDDDDADLAYGFSDWISDIYYESWQNYRHNSEDSIKKHIERRFEFPSLTNITTKRYNRERSRNLFERTNIMKMQSENSLAFLVFRDFVSFCFNLTLYTHFLKHCV